MLTLNAAPPPISVTRSLTRTKRSSSNARSNPASTGSHQIFASRERSWLAFNRRVLDQARNPANPLLERVKFLAIVCSNLDEFFEIRVAGLMQQADSEAAGELSLDGMTAREQLQLVYREVRALVAEQYGCWHGELIPQLAEQRIVFSAAAQLSTAERGWVEQFFETQVMPVRRRSRWISRTRSRRWGTKR